MGRSDGKILKHLDVEYKVAAHVMGKRTDYKKHDDLSCWDLDKGCRRIVDTSKPARRRLRDILRKAARKRLNRRVNDE